MLFKVFICVLLLCMGQATSVPTPIEVHRVLKQNTFYHMRNVFLEFPCSNKVIVNQLFDAYDKMSGGDLENAMVMLFHLAVVGNSSNISPDVWKLDLFKNVSGVSEDKLNELEASLHLSPAQSERLHIFFTEPAKTSKSSRIYLKYFAIGVSIGIPDDEVSQALKENGLDNESAAEKVGSLANEKCAQKDSNSGEHFYTNIVVDLANTFKNSN